jgi:two-component system, NtrC family, sensor kinase
MEKLKAKLEVSFSTKVLVPVVTIMVLLLGVTVWLLNLHVTGQFEMEARRLLAKAGDSVRTSEEQHTKNLLLRYRTLPNEPRYKAQLNRADQPTIKNWLEELLSEKDLDVILYSTVEKGEALANAKRDPLLSLPEFEAASSNVIAYALNSEEKADTIQVEDRLFDVVSVPVFGVGNHLIGALTFGSEIGVSAAKELRDVTQCQIVLMANGKVTASTVAGPELHEQFGSLFKEYLDGRKRSLAPMKKILIGDEHYFCAAGKFTCLNADGNLGYLLLFSYEQPLRALHKTQQLLLLVCTLGIILGTIIVWLFIRAATRPLRELRNSAEAVGRGDFSRRVEVYSRDECGELADVFNHMTENLKSSREQLELTVDTLKNTQAQLIQSEKLSGIGEFVAGVAHELNNPLTSVMGFSELLKKADQDPQHQRYLDMIHKSSLRCQKIVQSLLSFARRHQPERKLSSLNELLEAAAEMLQYQMRTSNIEVITRLDHKLPKVMVDPHQVQQVFLNIINNARQAIESHLPKGCVKLTSERYGDRARVIIEDNGPGISEAHLSKVFDPFFTTKEVGKGTGLGLSLCYGIVKEHGGHISVRSKLGSGSAFTIEFPLASEMEHDHENPEPSHSRPSLSFDIETSACEGAGKKVLVIDDEEPILHMVREVLTQQGYQVDLALDGETGLKRLKENAYDLTLCDWKMPGLNGQEVYERLRMTNPALSERMIFITGDVINENTRRFLMTSKTVCLTKPFSLSEFRNAVSKALAA